MKKLSALCGLAARGAVAGVAALVTACDTCPIATSCESSLPRMTIEGQIVTTDFGKGVDGIKIDMLFIGGRGSLAVDTSSTVTSDGGFWRMSVPAVVAESVLVRLRIFAPDLVEPYSVFRWVVPTTRNGEGYLADRWVIDPYFPQTLQVYHRGRSDEIFPNIVLDFRQTGGPRMRGLDAAGVIRTSTDAGGFAQFFLYSAFASDTGPVEGVVTAHLPAPYGDSKTILDLFPQIAYHALPTFGGLAVGPSLSYSVAITSKSSGRPVAGARIDFAKTGGIAVDPSTFSLTTDAGGRAVFPLVALGVGVVDATVTVTPPGGAPTTFPVSIPTFDADGTPLFATWAVSP
jgi:hypothetical protein